MKPSKPSELAAHLLAGAFRFPGFPSRVSFHCLCGQRCSADATKGILEHDLPACDQFLELGPVEFLKLINGSFS